MYRALIALSCALFCLGTLPTLAQTREALVDVSFEAERGTWLVGLATGYSLSYHTGGFRSVPGRDDVGVMEEGNGGGYQLGLTAEYLLSRYFSLVGRTVYDVRPSTFERAFPDTLFMEPGPQPAADSTARAEVGYRLITTDLLLSGRVVSFSPAVFLSLALGGSIGLVAGSDVTHWGERTDGSGARVYYSSDRPIDAQNSVRLAMKGGAGIEWHAAESVWIHARSMYDYGISDVSAASNWQLSSLLFQFDLLLSL